MAKRGYKLQEFVAHSGSVNCLKIGKKTCRLFVTGGDDQKVNLWSIGKPTSLASLCGHATPVESVTINSAEVLVLAGASAGVIKLWDLEETKMVRTLPGHRSYCSAVEFHPFGEFFASGSMDTNLKIWDIRKKGCIHTYKGHTRGISNIKFTPDGRWVVSGGLDNTVKIWDLTAGKLLHDFKSHEGHIRSIDFHPLEFLLATGSADRTVKLWDLETFELIGSTKPEATGVRSITFHPDGRTLFCGLDDSLKVVSWEPVVCHDAVDMGWSTLGDLSIHDGKLLGCSYYHNSVAVWAADISLIKPYGTGIAPDLISHPEEKHDLQEGNLVKQGSHRRATSSLRCPSPDYDTKEIKNIYVDTAGGKPVNSKSVGSPTVVTPSESNELKSVPSQKKVSTVGVQAQATGRAKAKSFIVPTLVLRDSPDTNDSTQSKIESVTSARASNAMSQKPSPASRQSSVNFDKERLLVPDVSEPISKERYVTVVDNCNEKFVAENNARENTEEKHLNVEVVAPKLEEIVSPKTPSGQENSNGVVNSSTETNSVKFVNGVAVVRGRTRSLVERFERREMPSGDEAQAPEATSPVKSPVKMMPEIPEAVPIVREEREIGGVNRDETARIGTNSDETTTINIDRDETTTIHACPPKDLASERAEVLKVTSPNSSITVNRSKRVGGINRNETTTVGTNRNETTTIGINRDETTTINACSPEDLASASERAEVRQVTGSNSSINARSRGVGGINRDETTGIGTNRDDTTRIGIDRDETTTTHACPTQDVASERLEVHQVVSSNSSRNVNRSRRVSSINRDETTRIGTNSDDTTTISINRDEITTTHACPPQDLASERSEVLQVASSNSSRNVNRSRRVGSINRDETTRISTNRVEARKIGINRDETTTIRAFPSKDLASERAEVRQVMGSNSSINVNRSRRVGGINRNETRIIGINRDETRIIGVNRDGPTTVRASLAKDLASERDEVLQVTGSNSSINVNRSRRVGGINRDEMTRVSNNRDETTTAGINRDETTAIHASPQDDLTSERAEDRHCPMNESHSTSSSDGSLLEDLMRNHDVFLSTLRSRVTKLQVVRHFWARNDIKGAIEAVRKLPDHSVQAEVISLLIEKMDILTLDLFSCLLPMLLGLLGSKMERHASISLEMLLKLVAVFGPVVRSTISAAPTVGVDLHKEQRIECCNQCFIQLQKIQRVLPVLIRRGGLLAKCAMELNLVLQD